VGKANEDTYSIFLGGNHSELKGNFRENFTMIGVFDGHGGVLLIIININIILNINYYYYYYYYY